MAKLVLGAILFNRDKQKIILGGFTDVYEYPKALKTKSTRQGQEPDAITDTHLPNPVNFIQSSTIYCSQGVSLTHDSLRFLNLHDFMHWLDRYLHKCTDGQ